MKIISLNCYGGHVFEPLIDYLKEESADTDVFCLQEVVSRIQGDRIVSESGWRINLLQEIEAVLPNFKVYFAPMQDDFDTDPEMPGESQFGIAIFYRKDLMMTEAGHLFIYNELNSYVKGDHSTIGHIMTHIDLMVNEQPLTLCSLHGMAMPGDKLDTPARLEQSRRVLDYLSPKTGAKIIMGDFNLFPETESIRMIERKGFKNLISEYAIKTTRGTLRNELFPEYADSEFGFQEFADYTFTSPEINVDTFEVPDVPISDHLPMILEFSL